MQKPSTDREFRLKVRAHHTTHGRHTLPWRLQPAPYQVMVSEYMLQQTQVERVIPKFLTFIKKFPNFKKLADATLPEVFLLWQGLGYNRRAKYLRDAARRIVQEKKGILPNDIEYLESLPGIGPYTARAIQTFAFGNTAPFIETNIRTAVMHHYFPRSRRVHDRDILFVLEGSIPRQGRAARLWYAALMDYGASLKKEGSRLNAKSFHYIKQKPFKGSRRELRGALMRALLLKAMSETSLAQSLAKPKKEIKEELSRLKKEGLVVSKGSVWRLSH